MTIHAFKDDADGYYQVDMPDGQPMPDWAEKLTPCAVLPTPAPTPAQVLAQYNQAVQGVLDAYATSMRYDSMLSMSTYVTSTNAQFKAEATAAVAWRDSVWASAYATLAAVQAGQAPMPTSVAAFIATLPAHP